MAVLVRIKLSTIARALVSTVYTEVNNVRPIVTNVRCKVLNNLEMDVSSVMFLLMFNSMTYKNLSIHAVFMYSAVAQ